MKSARIENWWITEGDQIIGQVYDHPDILDGEAVVTSRVAELNPVTGEAITKNTKYILGKRYSNDDQVS